MTIAERTEVPGRTELISGVPQMAPSAEGRRRFTCAEYYALAEEGVFDGQRVELIDGEIFQMSPQNFPHMSAISNVSRALNAVFGKDFWILCQSNINLLDASVPEPDFAVVSNEFRKKKVIPSAALLVVEVSHSTLQQDRGVKASLYASADIQEYWIVNVVDNRLEVHRDPTPDSAARFGKAYGSVQSFPITATIRPLAKPDAEIKVADLLP